MADRARARLGAAARLALPTLVPPAGFALRQACVATNISLLAAGESCRRALLQTLLLETENRRIAVPGTVTFELFGNSKRD
jgi:hypothetical protein